jgi:predicted GIY-YIG superfamily endonuclease
MIYCRDGVSRRAELAFITRVYMENGFGKSDIEKIIKRTQRNFYAKHQPAQLQVQPAGNEEKPVRVAFPFVPSVFYPLCRLGRSIGIHLVAQKSSSLGPMLCSGSKHTLPKDQTSGCIYQMECSCGRHYTGETDRDGHTRIAEHKDGHTRRQPGKAFSHHLDHQPDFDNYQILATEKRQDLRRSQVAIYICRNQRNTIESLGEWITNKNLGRNYSPVWTEVVERKMGPLSGT